MDVINVLLSTRAPPTSFLEVGILQGECGEMIRADRKVGVDVKLRDGVEHIYHRLHEGRSDDFFAENEERFDCVFIDGEHTQEQSRRDFDNAYDCLKPGGCIVLHDSNPHSFEHQDTPCDGRQAYPQTRVGWVWKTVVGLRRLPHLDTCTIHIETGVTVVEIRPNSAPLTLVGIDDYAALERHRVEALGLIDAREWIRKRLS